MSSDSLCALNIPSQSCSILPFCPVTTAISIFFCVDFFSQFSLTVGQEVRVNSPLVCSLVSLLVIKFGTLVLYSHHLISLRISMMNNGKDMAMEDR